MRNPFDLTELDNAVEEQQAHIDISAYQSHDGNRSLLQNENRRGDNLKDRFIGLHRCPCGQVSD
jgi:glycerol kinase